MICICKFCPNLLYARTNNSFMTDPLNIILVDFGACFLGYVQLSIYSTRAIFNKYFVAMTNR